MSGSYAMGFTQALAFTTASTNMTTATAAVQVQKDAGASTRRGGAQIGAVFLTAAATGGDATIKALLVKKGSVLKAITGTVSARTERTNSLAGTVQPDIATAAGRYCCDVEWESTTNHKLDLLGSHGRGNQDRMGPGLNGSDEGANWVLLVTDMGGLTDLEGILVTTPEAG